ncbi:cation H(+) antiporter 18-like [Olea europaea subsp. europaea]|uniref:Cation H(+) antiporter 18-like n=1 Tax=Olea europaea subsp. europaea TaxID=158383 RepID=A0A8S0U470_OLEEU|nr:cation H(+) antiporter 18-like [Olea europaea subsp. europaea]
MTMSAAVVNDVPVFVTDTIGIHPMFGAFVVGVLVPKEGPYAGALVEKVEDLVSGLFLPCTLF